MASTQLTTASSKSSSAVQKKAEDWVRTAYRKKHGINLTEQTIELPKGSKIRVDGLSEDGATVVEIFVRQDGMKAGQRRKIAMDALKLVTLKHAKPEIKTLALLVADESIANTLTSAGNWLAEALSTAGIKVEYVKLSPAQVDEIRSAQTTQHMANSAG